MSKLISVMGNNFALNNIKRKINGEIVTIKGYVDIDTFANIVNAISNSCFVENEYYAEFREVSRRYAIIKYLTDIELDDVGVEELFKSSQGGEWFNVIEREVVKLPLWVEIEQAVDKQIEYKIATRKTSFDILCDRLSAIMGMDLNENLADIKEVLNKLDSVDAKKFVKAVIEKDK